MHTAFRRSLTAGVALAGAGAIALVPSTVQADETPRGQAHRVVTAEVAPAAFWDTTTLLAEALRASLEQSIEALTTTSPVLLQEALANWPIAETELAYSQIANSLLVPVMPLVAGPFTEAVAEVLARSAPAFREQFEMLPTLVEHGTIRLLGPFLGAIGGAGAAHAEIYWATATGDIPGFVTAVARIPGYVIDGFLNGGYGDIGPLLSGSDGRVITPPGLLTPWNSDLLGGANGTADDAADVAVEADEITDTDLTTEPAAVVTAGNSDRPADIEDLAEEPDENSTADDVPAKSWRWGPARALAVRTEQIGAEIDKGVGDFRRSARGGLKAPADGAQQEDGDPAAGNADATTEDSADESEKGTPTTDTATDWADAD